MAQALIGTVKREGQASAIACRIQHLSPFGARLTLLQPVVIDGEFTLCVGRGGSAREARVVHRDGLTVFAELRPARKAPAARSRPAA